jgi:hypothetical protein
VYHTDESARISVLQLIPILYSPSKPGNFWSYPLFNSWEVKYELETTSLNWISGKRIRFDGGTAL